MIELDEATLREAFGLGVAGNFAGHLEQAGEASDFVSVTDAPSDAPKGIFPFYVPGGETFLGTFPVSADRLGRPAGDEVNLQIEPEAGVACTVAYDPGGAVEALVPFALGAFNDCSIRREGAAKISHKKNWGPDSKGMARRCFAVSELEPDGATATFRLASFLRRDGEAHAYGTDSPLPGYTYYGERLLGWIAGRLTDQRGADGTPLEDVGALLAGAGRPRTVLVGIGATRYEPFGERTYLRAGDTSLVVVYDSGRTSPEDVAAAVGDGREDDLPEASVLRQAVYAA